MLKTLRDLTPEYFYYSYLELALALIIIALAIAKAIYNFHRLENTKTNVFFQVHFYFLRRVLLLALLLY